MRKPHYNTTQSYLASSSSVFTCIILLAQHATPCTHPPRVKAEVVIRAIPLFPMASFASLLLTIGDQEDDWTIGYPSDPEQEAGRRGKGPTT